MSSTEVVYLGPPGTFAHEVAKKRYGRSSCDLVSRESVAEVCERVSRKSSAKGIVPIENSSGGWIYGSVDALIGPSSKLLIEEELSIDVRLALLGRRGEKIETIFTHFAPKQHCRTWLKKHYRNAEVVEVSSTAVAAKEASHSLHSAAISNRMAAPIYGMDVLAHPIPTALSENVTYFFVISRKPETSKKPAKTSLSVRLKNDPGSLCEFLTPMRQRGINLSRIISRPIEGLPKEAAFFIDLDGGIDSVAVQQALAEAKEHTLLLRVLGSYPRHRAYKSS